MSRFSRTWWGQHFIQAMETITDSGRLSRGRSYAGGGKVLNFNIDLNRIVARVRGSINPYFGVYKEPRYDIFINMKSISAGDWSKVIKSISTNAAFLCKLLMNEMPDNIEDVFSSFNLRLLPGSRKDFDTECSCPDWANPCKHIAGTYYLVASELDNDPFLMFELRGLSRDELKRRLAKTKLGKILVSSMSSEKSEPVISNSYYTRVDREPVNAQNSSLKQYWGNERKFKDVFSDLTTDSGISAALIKKQSHFPPFWNKDNSFIEAMEAFYSCVKLKNKIVKKTGV